MMNFIRKNILYIFLIIISPGFWWIATQPGKLVSELQRSPSFFKGKIASLSDEERIMKIGKLRWANQDQGLLIGIFSKFAYNKAYIIPDEFFSMTSFLSPRFYFQAGDGEGLSPPGVEPIPVILFPFWLSGILVLIKQRRFLPLFLAVLLASLAFLFGQRTIPFLWPVFFIYIFMVKEGLTIFKSRPFKISYLIIFCFYSFYLIGRALFLSSKI